MTLNDWLTLAAIVIGPLVAVGITLWIEGRRKTRDSRIIVLRQLMATRHLPADPMYSQAINLVPVEFNDQPAVISAYKAYHDAIRRRAGDNSDDQTDSFQVMVAKQTKLIYAIMQSLGLKASEADLPIEAYAASGMMIRDALYLDSLRAQLRIAESLERQTAMIAQAPDA